MIVVCGLSFLVFAFVFIGLLTSRRYDFMLLYITECCSLGCTHCIDDAKPDGQHMTLETLEASMDFIIKNNIYHSVIVTGGEPTEHPLFPMFMGYIIASLAKLKRKCVVTVTTNGFWILENEENRKVCKRMIDNGTDVEVQFQVSADTRFYPKRLDVTKRIWREEGFVLCDNCVLSVYPQGRAKTNKLPWNAKASKCFNVRAITKQCPNPTLSKIVWTLALNKKFCTPSIKINGDIVLGESRLCPTVATIYDNETDIIQKIKDFKCDGCYPVNENLADFYKQFIT